MHIRPQATPTLSELFSNKASNKAYETQQKSFQNVFCRAPWWMVFTIPFLTATFLCLSRNQYTLWSLSQKSPHKIYIIYIGHYSLKVEIRRSRSYSFSLFFFKPKQAQQFYCSNIKPDVYSVNCPDFIRKRFCSVLLCIQGLSVAVRVKTIWGFIGNCQTHTNGLTLKISWLTMACVQL